MANLPRGQFAAVIVCLLAALLLGGGTRAGFLGDAIAQLVAVAALLYGLATLNWHACTREVRLSLVLAACLLTLPLLQLLPLPPMLWQALPGRDAAAAALEAAGRADAWMPVSLAPEATRLAFLATLPAIAVFCGTLQLTRQQRRHATLVVMGFGVLALMLGLLQVAQGPESPLRPFAVTNRTEAVGLFANRNHFSALLYVVLVLAAAWAVHASGAYLESSGRSRRLSPAVLLPLLASFLLIVLIVAAQTFTRSRGGIALTVLGLLLAGTMSAGYAVTSRNSTTTWWTPTRMLMVAAVAGTVLTVQLTLYRLLERFGNDVVSNSTRELLAEKTAAAGLDHLPFGAGMGAFMPAYAMTERPSEAVIDVYVNRAHNDVLELWVEAGLLGAIGIVAFGLWFAWRARAAWWFVPTERMAIDGLLPRAATIIVALLLLHSLADYPLRTIAMSTMFAFACGLLLPAPRGDFDEAARDDDAFEPASQPVRTQSGHPPQQGAPRRPPGIRQPSTAPPPATPFTQGFAGADWPSDGGSAAPADRTPRARSGLRPHEVDWEPTAPSPHPSAPAPPSAKPGTRWGEGVEWPESWREHADPSRAGRRGAAQPPDAARRWPADPGDRE